MKAFGSALIALAALLSASDAAVITKGSDITAARKALVADKHPETHLQILPTTEDTNLDFWTVDEGVLVLSHSTKTGLITGLSYTLGREEPKSTRKTFDFEVESFDTTSGRLVLKTKNPSTALPSDLSSLVGKHVRLEGRFGGPGKLADYVVVPGGQVYLFGKVTGEVEHAYGSTVSIEGVLGYHSYSPSPSTEDGSKAIVAAQPPDHYYIENPNVHTIAPPAGMK